MIQVNAMWCQASSHFLNQTHFDQVTCVLGGWQMSWQKDVKTPSQQFCGMQGELLDVIPFHDYFQGNRLLNTLVTIVSNYTYNRSQMFLGIQQSNTMLAWNRTRLHDFPKVPWLHCLSSFKVTRDKKIVNLDQTWAFQTVTQVWINWWLENAA